jgi:rod shape-determining protein MreD
MRWIPFILLAYLMLGLQIGLGGLMPHGGVNFVLIAAVFLSINAQRSAAVPACFALGLLQDLAGIGTIGTYAMTYSVLALLIAGTDRALSAEHPLTHFVITLIGGIVTAILVWLQGRLGAYGVPTPLADGLISAFYSALAAIPALWLLNRMRKAFRFRFAPRR